MISWKPDVLIAALLLSAGICVISYLYQRCILTAIVRAVVKSEPDSVGAMFAIAKFVFSKVLRAPDPVFLFSLFRPLGASPLAVLRRGGCCSGVHRLFIACLDVIGIRAAQVTLYHPSGKALHCVAQVSVQGRVLVIDVDYGVVFEHPNKGTLGLTQLREGIEPTIRVFADGLAAPTLDEPCDRIPGYRGKYHTFNFKETRTVGWTSSWVRRKAYLALKFITNGRIDCVLLPPLLEWPQIILALLVSSAALLILISQAALMFVG